MHLDRGAAHVNRFCNFFQLILEIGQIMVSQNSANFSMESVFGSFDFFIGLSTCGSDYNNSPFQPGSMRCMSDRSSRRCIPHFW
jgi:hypothetical protein